MWNFCKKNALISTIKRQWNSYMFQWHIFKILFISQQKTVTNQKTNLQIFIEFDLTIHIGIDFPKNFMQFLPWNISFTKVLSFVYMGNNNKKRQKAQWLIYKTNNKLYKIGYFFIILYKYKAIKSKKKKILIKR